MKTFFKKLGWHIALIPRKLKKSFGYVIVLPLAWIADKFVLGWRKLCHSLVNGFQWLLGKIRSVAKKILLYIWYILLALGIVMSMRNESALPMTQVLWIVGGIAALAVVIVALLFAHTKRQQLGNLVSPANLRNKLNMVSKEIVAICLLVCLGFAIWLLLSDTLSVKTFVAREPLWTTFCIIALVIIALWKPMGMRRFSLTLLAIILIAYPLVKYGGQWGLKLPEFSSQPVQTQPVFVVVQREPDSRYVTAFPGKWSDIVEIPPGYKFDTIVLVGDDSNPRYSILKNESGQPIQTTLNEAKNIKLGEHVGEMQYMSLENYPLKIKVVFTKI